MMKLRPAEIGVARHALVLHAVEDDVLVHLVADDEQAGPAHERAEGPDVVGPQDGARRVVRRVEHEQARARGNRPPDRVPVHGVIGRPQGDDHRSAAAEHDGGNVRVVARLEHDHFVALTDDRRYGVENRLRAAGRDGDLAVGVVPPVVEACERARDRLTQRQDALHRRVLVLPGAHVPRNGIDERGVAVEVREPLREVDRAELAGQPRHHGEDRRPDRRQLRLDVGRHRASKTPVVLFLRTRSHRNRWPFIAT